MCSDDETSFIYIDPSTASDLISPPHVTSSPPHVTSSPPHVTSTTGEATSAVLTQSNDSWESQEAENSENLTSGVNSSSSEHLGGSSSREYATEQSELCSETTHNLNLSQDRTEIESGDSQDSASDCIDSGMVDSSSSGNCDSSRTTPMENLFDSQVQQIEIILNSESNRTSGSPDSNQPRLSTDPASNISDSNQTYPGSAVVEKEGESEGGLEEDESQLKTVVVSHDQIEGIRKSGEETGLLFDPG